MMIAPIVGLVLLDLALLAMNRGAVKIVRPPFDWRRSAFGGQSFA